MTLTRKAGNSGGMLRFEILTLGLVVGCAHPQVSSGLRPTAQVQLSEHLRVTPLTSHSWVIASEPWHANSLVVELDDGTLALADTPSTQRDMETLLAWIAKTFGERPMVTFNGHYHLDALGGNQVLQQRGLPVYGSDTTVALLRERGGRMKEQLVEMFADVPEHRDAIAATQLLPPDHVLPRSGRLQVLTFGSDEVRVHHIAHGHSPDNLVVEFPRHGIVFGGCVMRSGESLGNVSEANPATWVDAASYVESLGAKYVIPGHGQGFGSENATRTRLLAEAAWRANGRKSIEKVWATFKAQYASGNAAGVAGLWAEDGDLFTLSGGILKGRDRIASFFSETLEGPYRGSEFTLDLDEVRFLSSKVAVADGTWEVSGENLPKGYPTGGLYSQVLERRGDRWVIVAARPSVPLQGHTGNVGRQQP